MIKKLRWKFVLVMTAFSMAVLCLVLFFSFATMKNNIEQENEKTLKQIAEMQQVSIMGLPRFQTDNIRVPYFMVDVSQSGMVSNLQSNYMRMDAQVDEELLLDLVANALKQKENMGVLTGEDLRFYRKAKIGGWRLVYLDMTMENNMIRNLSGNMLLIGLGSFVGIFFLSMGLAYWITKPVERAWNQQRQFVADASHELKTPLTVILSNTDMLLNQCTEADEHSEKRLGNIRAESIRMKGLVEDMLDLARSDAGHLKQQLAPVSVSDTVMDAVLLFEALAFERQKELQYQIEENLSVLGSGDRLKQLTEILLDNAMKYSPEQGCIWVKLERNSAKTLRLMVANTGDTMTPEQCRRIFERFYRTDPARQNNGGYGLGLSIASSIVTEMGGKIWCESRNGINSFFVQLPLCREE
ncbi:MAG: HAMP domain-containing histidine kinase [Ruminococcaceae bacterium]|nr:HAMP domain-containing histidine kinase [Oscillospiraceae bacterium]